MRHQMSRAKAKWPSLGRSPRWMAQGRGAGRERRSRSARRGRVRQRCPCPTPSPRYPEARSLGLKDAAAGAPTSATLRLRTGVRRAPATPFASCEGTSRRDKHHPGRIPAREGGRVCEPLPVIPGERRRREGRGPSKRCPDSFGLGSGYWVPAFAGMTGFGSRPLLPPAPPDRLRARSRRRRGRSVPWCRRIRRRRDRRRAPRSPPACRAGPSAGGR